MKELFFSEFRRFRNAALIGAGLHLAVLLILNRMVDLIQRRTLEMQFLAIFYIIAGLAFAFIQFGTVRQPGRWIWLMHRPISPASIFASTALASAALIFLAVGLPVLLAVLGTDWLSARTVDLRHYGLVLQLVLLVIAAWLCGSYTILNRSYTAIVVLVLPVLLFQQLAAVPVALFVAALVLALLSCIVLGTFKPDRKTPPRKLALQVATALPLQIGFYLVLTFGGSILWQSSQIVFGNDPLNREVPPAGGYIESTRAKSIDVLKTGLQLAQDPHAKGWIATLEGSKPMRIGRLMEAYPVRHQPGNPQHVYFQDSKQGIVWTFSHDAMRFHGRDKFTGRDRGWLGLHGVGDTARFPGVPVVDEEFSLIYTPQAAYSFNAGTGQIRELLALKAPETLAGFDRSEAGHKYALTNARLIAFKDGAEHFSVALPGPYTDLERIDVLPVDEGTLASFTFGATMIEGGGDASQILMLIDPSGKALPLARRDIVHDFPVLFEHHRWWVSPVLHFALSLPEALLDKGIVLDQGASHNTRELLRDRPQAAWFAAVFSSLAAALIAAVWMRRSEASARQKAGWIIACLVLGLPSVLSLMVLRPRPPPRIALPQAVPAAA
jgi:hypothetical protein